MAFGAAVDIAPAYPYRLSILKATTAADGEAYIDHLILTQNVRPISHDIVAGREQVY